MLTKGSERMRLEIEKERKFWRCSTAAHRLQTNAETLREIFLSLSDYNTKTLPEGEAETALRTIRHVADMLETRLQEVANERARKHA